MEWINYIERAEQPSEMVPGEVTREFSGNLEAREFSESMESRGIVGNPESAAEVWHMQEHPMSCAVVCQEFIAEELLGKEFSEAKMRDYAQNREWFSDGGTLLSDVGKLLEEMGLDVERSLGTTVEDLKVILNNGGKVMAGVNNMVLSNSLYAILPGISANHMVEVTGIDERDPKHTKVILNDPGVRDGAGREIELNTFMMAWNTSGCYTVSAFRPNGGASV